MLNRKMLVVLGALLPVFAFAGPPAGEKPKTVTLDKDQGGLVTGGGWNSDSLKGKVHVVFYVDPDFADLNNPASEALKKADFPKDKFQSVAVINMGATWLPNFAIDGKLKDKQKEYPDTLYVRDLKKALVKQWNLKDDSSDLVVLDKEGKVRFVHEGKLDPAAIKQLIETVRQHL
ncbi:MAG: YtfJ family protein [Myxococcota bacterium]|nr:YtfJ family protein [Myxococcota bacterium]